MRYLVASTVCVAILVSACSHNNSSSTPATSRQQATTQETVASKPPAPSHFRAGAKAYAGATRTVVRSTPETLVNIPGFGSLTVSCTTSGIARTVFTVRSRPLPWYRCRAQERSPQSSTLGRRSQGAGKINGLVRAGVVWVVIALLLLRWWRTRNDPRPPSHSG